MGMEDMIKAMAEMADQLLTAAQVMAALTEHKMPKSLLSRVLEEIRRMPSFASGYINVPHQPIAPPPSVQDDDAILDKMALTDIQKQMIRGVRKERK
jgi:hypothetical protein